MKLKKTVAILTLISALIITNFIGNQVFSQAVPPVVPLGDGVWEKFGPRVDRLTFKIAGSVSAEAMMLEQGEIDLMDWSAPGAEWATWLADPMVTMGEYMELSMIYIAPNLARWPLGHGDQLPAGVSDWDYFGDADTYRGNHRLDYWPTELEGDVDGGGTCDTYFIDPDCQRCKDARQYRRALAHLVNRDPIITHMKGAGTPMETLILPPVTSVWENASAKMGTLYPFSLSLAADALAAGGFKDYDGDGWVEYNPNVAVREAWDPGDPEPAGTEEVPSIDVYIRQDDPDRVFAGTFFTQQMQLAGIPNNPIITSNTICSQHVWQAPYHYDIYIEYWDWGTTIPDLYYEGFHSSKDLYPESWSDNSVRYHSKAFDLVAEEFLEATTSAEAVAPCKKMQSIMSEDATVIPLYDYSGYMGMRTEYGAFPGEGTYQDKNWTGINNEQGIGFATVPWNMLNLRPQGLERGIDGKCTLRHGLVNDITDWNILRTWWFYDLQVLLQIYEYLIYEDPTNPGSYIPWLCESFTEGTWDMAGETCSAINFTMIPNILWQDNELLTVEDVAFSFQYNKDWVTMYYFAVKNFEESVTYDTDYDGIDDTIEIRFNILSWLATGWAGSVPIIPMHIWDGENPKTFNPGAVGVDAVIGSGPFMFFGDNVVGKVDRVFGQYVYLVDNPTYFRELVRPDYQNQATGAPTPDGYVGTKEFGTCGGQFGYADPNWRDPTFGPLADVNKDLVCDIDDVMEVAARFGLLGCIEGYPGYYM